MFTFKSDDEQIPLNQEISIEHAEERVDVLEINSRSLSVYHTREQRIKDSFKFVTHVHTAKASYFSQRTLTSTKRTSK